MASSPACNVVAIGTSSGRVYFVDLNQLEDPRIIHCHKLYHSTVRHLAYVIYLPCNYIVMCKVHPIYVFWWFILVKRIYHV